MLGTTVRKVKTAPLGVTTQALEWPRAKGDRVAGGIFLIKGDGELVELSEEAYDSEALLQGLLARYPRLLGGDDAGSATRSWLLIEREVGVPDNAEAPDRWAVDHLFLDQDAIPTLVEVKRSTDTRIRREVVGQMLDYAANAIVYWPVETIRAKFEARCDREELDPALVLTETFGADCAPEELWERVKTNLQAGKIRMLFVADVIPPELRRVVEFLNTQMDPAEVLALEIRQFVGEDLKTLVPRVIGQTAEAQQKKRGGGTGAAAVYLRGADEFIRSIEQAPVTEQSRLRRLAEWAQALERDGLTRLGTSVGKIRWVLNLYLLDEDVVLVSIWNEAKKNDRNASVTAWRTVFERRAPKSLTLVEAASPVPVGQGRCVYDPSDKFLDAIRTGYEEAAGLREPKGPSGP
jgi:hypothetical protein